MRHSCMPASICACLLLASFASAQELAAGKYTGSYFPPQFQEVLIVLSIQSVDGGNVTGTGERHVTFQSGKQARAGCIGVFPLVGTVMGSAVDLRSGEKWGPAGDCRFRLRGAVSGDKIRGKLGENEIELSK